MQFPAFGTTSATPFTAMSRVTLRNHLPANGPIDKLMADYIFQSQDDLTLELPSDRSMPPQNVLTGGGSNTRRQFEGSMSWMVTLVPKVGAYNSDNSDLFTASIVVFHSRPFDEKAERLAVVTSFPGAGIAGGDVSLTADDNQELDIQTNQWIMLSGQTPSTPYYRWYRVLGTDTVKGSPTANVTLQGPDWNPSIPAQATIMPGVVAVYEKTVRLETSSLWNN
ncbi:MAG TPA: hypothetical protein VL096_13355 [Pirellulaceae bacterium]|nr:hypothetical protein [Pirellulaceae bacterium]